MADDDTEQQLREEIASQKAAIADLPSLSFIIHATGLASPETKARAQLIKELSDTEERLELLLESKRVAAVVRLQDELHPPEVSEDCPICLETIKHVNIVTVARLWCCGGWMCRQCIDKRKSHFEREGFDEGFRNKCPFCREEMHGKDDFKKEGDKVLEHSNKGRAWAQFQIGTWYSNEMLGKKYGFPLDKEKGLQFMKQAADQRDSDALCWMAAIYSDETNDSDKQSKYMHYLKEAADLGHLTAQQKLADTYFRNGDYKKALHYTTLAASQGESEACGWLGYYFFEGECGLTESLILAKHYSEKCIEYATQTGWIWIRSLFASTLSFSMLQLGHARYEGELEIPGHSPFPKSLFWARFALNGESSNDGFLVSIEEKVKGHCANCRKEGGCSSLKRCVRCSGAWYCGKECQAQHWKAGHKIDCIKSKY